MINFTQAVSLVVIDITPMVLWYYFLQFVI